MRRLFATVTFLLLGAAIAADAPAQRQAPSDLDDVLSAPKVIFDDDGRSRGRSGEAARGERGRESVGGRGDVERGRESAGGRGNVERGRESVGDGERGEARGRTRGSHRTEQGTRGSDPADVRRSDRRDERRDETRRSDRRDDVFRGERGHRKGGPAFCRSGAGHPVFGREWCRAKGFGLGNETLRRGRYDDGGPWEVERRRRSADGGWLEDILGRN